MSVRPPAASDEVVDDGRCFACGPKNDAGLGLRFEPPGDGVRSAAVIPQPFQGWRGIVHGGIVMTLLDEGMAHAAGAARVSRRHRRDDGALSGAGSDRRAALRDGPRRLAAGPGVRPRSAASSSADGTVLAEGTGKFVERGPLAPGERLGVPDGT